MSLSKKIPVTIVTGFLGAGKTTLIRHLLEHADGRRIALVINEFGDMGFDGSLLAGCDDPACLVDDIVELTNGCICCTVADDFLPTMETLLARDPAPDHIVIETSGLALPQPLVRAFSWPTIRNRVTVDGVVAVADAAALSDGRLIRDEEEVERQRRVHPNLDHETPIEELFEDQMACADLVVLSKVDLIGDAGRQTAESKVAAATRPGIHTTTAKNGVIAPEILLGIGAAAEDDTAARAGHHPEGEEHDHDDFASFVLQPAPLESAEDAQPLARELLAAPGVLRVKGLVTVAGKSAPLVVQGVGGRVESWFDYAIETIDRKLVVIGETGMDRAAVERLAAREVA